MRHDMCKAKHLRYELTELAEIGDGENAEGICMETLLSIGDNQDQSNPNDDET